MRRKLALLFCFGSVTAWCAENRIVQRRTQESEGPVLIKAFQRGFSPTCPEEIKVATELDTISVPRVLGFSQIATCSSLERDVQADEWGGWAQQMWGNAEGGIFLSGMLFHWWRLSTKEEAEAGWVYPMSSIVVPVGTLMCGAASMVGAYFSGQIKKEWQKSIAEVSRNRLNLDPLYPIISNAFQQNPALRFSSQQVEKLVLSLMQRPKGLIVE